MATWVRNNTGTLPSATDVDVVGNASLDNATAPGDFDPTAVSSVRIQWTVAKTSGTIVDDVWTARRTANLAIGTLSGDQIAAVVAASDLAITEADPSRSFDATDSTIATTFSVAQWESAFAREGFGGTHWVSYSGSKMADGVTVAVTAVTVTITYTPPVTISPLLGLRMPQSIVHRM